MKDSSGWFDGRVTGCPQLSGQVSQGLRREAKSADGFIDLVSPQHCQDSLEWLSGQM